MFLGCIKENLFFSFNPEDTLLSICLFIYKFLFFFITSFKSIYLVFIQYINESHKIFFRTISKINETVHYS